MKPNAFCKRLPARVINPIFSRFFRAISRISRLKIAFAILAVGNPLSHALPKSLAVIRVFRG